MQKNELIQMIEKEKIIAIVRGLTKEKLISTVNALLEGGIRLVEVTFDQSGTYSEDYVAGQIRAITEEFKGDALPGAGTVMNVRQTEIAYSAGANYIISPNTDKSVIEKTVELCMVSIPGALTPTEAASAHDWGADFVKLFPAGELGLGYIKALKAPLNHIRFLAVGGVDHNNLGDFLKAGISGVGIGSNIVKKDLIDAEQYQELTKLAKRYTTIAKGE